MKHWRLGKPLAAEGLNLKTVRTTIPALTAEALRPTAHPLAELVFLPSGEVEEARFIERSGDKNLDEYLLDALHNWQATGEKIDLLKSDQRITIRLRLLLN